MNYNHGPKRVIDIIVSVAALILFSPFIFISSMYLFIISPGPIFFKQDRVGYRQRIFTIYKIRTMRIDHKRKESQVYDDDPNLIIGMSIIRRLKIDEMPQAFNILCGDMSILGPRPCLPETLEGMPEWARHRFSVRPGLTGLAQVNGNIFLNWEERWKFDIKYVENINFWNDLKILFKTLVVILMGEKFFKASI